MPRWKTSMFVIRKLSIKQLIKSYDYENNKKCKIQYFNRKKQEEGVETI